MAALLLPSRLRQQPRGARAKVDWSNPITRGLVIAVLPDSTRNLANTSELVPVSGYTTAYNRNGLATSTESLQWPQPVNSSDLGAEYDLATLSAFVYGQQTSIQNSAATFSRAQGSATVDGWSVGFHGGSSSGASATAAGNFLAPPFAFADVTKPTSALLTLSAATDVNLYCNGQLQNTATYTTPTYQYGGFQRRVLFGSKTGPGTDTTNQLAVGLLWNRVLSPAEIASISENPWQVFQAPARRLWVPSVGGAPTTLTGASSVSSALSSAGAVSQLEGVTGLSCVQTGVSSASAVTQIQPLSGTSDIQDAASTAGSLTQGQNLSAAASTQPAISSAGTLTQGGLVPGLPSVQSSTSSGGALSQVQVLTGSGTVQAAVSAVSGVTQVQSLSGAASTQAAVSSIGALFGGLLLTVPGSYGVALSSSSNVAQTQALAASASTSTAQSSADALARTLDLTSAASTESSTSGTGAISVITTVNLAGAPCAQPSASSSVSLSQVQALLAAISQGAALSSSAIVSRSVTLSGLSCVSAMLSSTGSLTAGIDHDVYLLIVEPEQRILLSGTEGRVLDWPIESRILRTP